MLHNKRFARGYVPGFQKTYLSREVTRAWSIEHPIGDPHGGPAYGERNDPVSAIISIGTLVATGGAVVAGTASLMTGLMFAGAAISLVGNLTGNKTLSKIGMITGLAGGVGALAESAGLFASGTLGETFGYGAGAATGAPAVPLSETVNPAAGADVSGNIVDGAGVVTSPVANPAPVQGVDLGPLSSGPGADLAAGAANPTDLRLAAGTQASPFSSESLMASSSTVAGAPAAPAAPGVDVPSVTNPTDLRLAAGTQTTPMSKPGFFDSLSAGNLGDAASSAWTGVKDLGASWMEMAKKNPAMATMMGNTISSVADVLSGKADATVQALEAQGQLSKAQADKLRFEMEEYKRRVAQQNTNYTTVANPLAKWTPNFQTTSTAQPGQGLVAGAMGR